MEPCLSRFAERSTFRQRVTFVKAVRREVAEQSLDVPVTKWWTVSVGVKLALRSGPSHDATLCGQSLEERTRFLVTERVEVAGVLDNGMHQTFLRLAGVTPAWAFMVNRKTGQLVCEELALSEGRAEDHRIRSEELIAAGIPRQGLQRLLLSALLSINNGVETATGTLTSLYNKHGCATRRTPFEPLEISFNTPGMWIFHQGSSTLTMDIPPWPP